MRCDATTRDNYSPRQIQRPDLRLRGVRENIRHGSRDVRFPKGVKMREGKGVCVCVRAGPRVQFTIVDVGHDLGRVGFAESVAFSCGRGQGGGPRSQVERLHGPATGLTTRASVPAREWGTSSTPATPATFPSALSGERPLWYLYLPA